MANSPKLRGTYDLLALLILTGLLALSILFIRSNMPRIILGLPFILFLPGYAMVAALVPRKDSISLLERAALSSMLSLAIVPLIGLLLNYAWEISVYPILISLGVFIAAMCILAFFHRLRLPPQERFELEFRLRQPSWAQQSRLDRVLAALLALALIGAVSTAIYVGVRPKAQQPFTEFYLLGASGKMQYYPKAIVLGADADVIVGVTNREGEAATYQIRISIGGTEARVMDAVALEDGENWQDTVTLKPTRAGDKQEVEFLLYRNEEPEHCEELRLWIDVRNP